MAKNVIHGVEGLVEVVKTAEELTKASKELITLLHDLIDTIFSAVDDTIVECNALHYKKIDCEGREKELQRGLKRVAEKAYIYAGKVGQLYQYGGDTCRQTNVRQALQCGNLAELSTYVSELQRRLGECEESYQDAQEAINKLISECQRAAGFCEKKAKEANTKRKLTNGFGGTAAAGSVVAGAAGAVTAGGVVAFVITGSLTFRVGAIVGLGVTAVAAGVVGGGAAIGADIATHLIASNFKEVEKQFKHLGWSFNRIQSRASSIEDFINVLKTELKLIEYAVDNTNPSKRCSEFIAAFDCLCEAFGQSREASEFQKKLKEKNSELRARFDEALN